MMVLCSRLRRSNMRTLPSAPHETKVSTLPAQKRTSKTSLSCAMSCVLAVSVGMSQMVHVVSMEEVMMSLGETLFQSRLVSGAVCSGVFELESRARGVSLVTFVGLVLEVELRVMVLVEGEGTVAGSDQSRRWSPDVASRSVVCFCDDGGSHKMRVTG